jgi:hypothetical protein
MVRLPPGDRRKYCLSPNGYGEVVIYVIERIICIIAYVSYGLALNIDDVFFFSYL